MTHERRVVADLSPGDPHAYDGIPLRDRTGDLDARCPVCAGHGQWNNEFDLVTQRSKRTICPTCGGRTRGSPDVGPYWRTARSPPTTPAP